VALSFESENESSNSTRSSKRPWFRAGGVHQPVLEDETFAVYRTGASSEFRQVRELHEQGRAQGLGAADYTEDSHTSLWIT
jgi:hypothetical protein